MLRNEMLSVKFMRSEAKELVVKLDGCGVEETLNEVFDTSLLFSSCRSHRRQKCNLSPRLFPKYSNLM